MMKTGPMKMLVFSRELHFLIEMLLFRRYRNVRNYGCSVCENDWLDSILERDKVVAFLSDGVVFLLTIIRSGGKEDFN